MNRYSTSLLIVLLFIQLGRLAAQVSLNSYTDHHVHLQDSATVELGYRMLKATGSTPTKIDSMILDADTILRRLDKAKFKGAWILSNAYWFGSPLTPVENEYEEVKKQNDWTAEQAARSPERLKAFMSVNPLKPYALTEVQRCAETKKFTGIKLHFANSKIDLSDKAHITRLQEVFSLADKHGLFILAHFRNGKKWNGRTNTEILLKQLIPFAKNTNVILAHMAGWGGYDKPTDAALKLIAAYLHEDKSGSKNLYFDVSAVLPLDPQKGRWNAMAALNERISQIGKVRILFATDWPLTDIDPYIQLLNSALGATTVEQILKNTVD